MRQQYGLAAFIGFAFAWFRFGWDVLNPLNIEWMMHMSDHAAHFVAWHFFRQEAWAFPLGMINNYMYPMGTTIAFIDAIPLMALVFRLFSDMLPPHFQYFGLWMFVSHALHMVFGLALMRTLLPGRPVVSWLGALLLLFNPVMIARVEHVGLASHWLLLWGFWLYFSSVKQFDFKKYVWGWWSLITLAAWITPYLFTMTFSIALVSWFRETVISRSLRWSQLLHVVVVVVGSFLISFWLQGYFSFQSMSFDAYGYGHFSLNLFGLFNPMGASRFLPTLPYFYIDQGYGYLGLGGLILGLLWIIHTVMRALQKRLTWSKTLRSHWPLLVLMVLTFIFSLSHQITLGDRLLFTIPIQEGGFFYKIGSMFRATERFVWIFHYLFFITGIVFVLRQWPGKLGMMMLAGILLIQVVDLNHYQNIPDDRHVSRLTDPRWAVLVEKFEVIVPIPPFQRHTLHYDDFKDFAMLAADAQKKLAAGYVARRPKEAINRELSRIIQQIKEARPDPTTLYVFSSVTLLPFREQIQKVFHCIPLDDYFACFDNYKRFEPLY